jgi:hypothetical protein
LPVPFCAPLCALAAERLIRPPASLDITGNQAAYGLTMRFARSPWAIEWAIGAKA